MGISIKGKGGGARVTIDGKPVTEKLQLKKAKPYFAYKIYLNGLFGSKTPIGNEIMFFNNYNYLLVTVSNGNDTELAFVDIKKWIVEKYIKIPISTDDDIISVLNYKNECIYILTHYKHFFVIKNDKVTALEDIPISSSYVSVGDACLLERKENVYILCDYNFFEFNTKTNIMTELKGKPGYFKDGFAFIEDDRAKVFGHTNGSDATFEFSFIENNWTSITHSNFLYSTKGVFFDSKLYLLSSTRRTNDNGVYFKLYARNEPYTIEQADKMKFYATEKFDIRASGYAWSSLFGNGNGIYYMDSNYINVLAAKNIFMTENALAN